MKTLVVGDIHGCGLELQELVAKAGLSSDTDQLVLVGDIFDRAKHPHVVWETLQGFGERAFCVLGNHERKMLKYLLKERQDLPRHYFWAMAKMSEFGVSGVILSQFLSRLPTILVYRDKFIGFPNKSDDLKNGDVIIAHAGVDINWPLNPEPSYTVYGDFKPTPWWDRYKGENLVIYGHLSERDHKPRIRMGGNGEMNSIGLDTACCHGGELTGYIIETQEIISVKAHKDWATELKAEMA
jgi:hypothetical protein